MFYSRSTQYAIRAIAHLAREAADGFVPVRDVARETQIPLPFLAKIMHTLARNGLIRSQKGPGGGVALARPADRINLEDVVFAVDGKELLTDCVLGLPRCSDTSPCPVHEVWKGLRARLIATLHERTVADVGAPAASRARRPVRRARRR